MKYFYTLLLIAFLFPLLSYGQSNYKPGLIVTLKGDTVNGFVDYKEWENNPASVNFKTALSASAQTYTPNDIKYFQINHSEAYQKYDGSISNDEVDVNRLSRGRDTSSKTVTVFLKVEQGGNYITLYSYTDNLKKRYFIAEKTTRQATELIYRLYMVTEQDGNKTMIENKYKGQLIYLAAKYKSNSDALQSLIENSSYDQDLVNVVSKINRSTKQTSEHANKATSFYVGISAGPASIKQPSTYSNFNPDITPQNSYLPRVALGVNIYTNPDVGKLVFRAELAFTAHLFKTYQYEFLATGTKSYYTLNQYTASLNPQILYNIYNTDKFKFYLAGGLSMNFSQYSNNKYYNGQYNTVAYGRIPYASNWFSYPFTAGVLLNQKIGIFATYTLPATISNDNYKAYSTQVGVTYTFGHRK